MRRIVLAAAVCVWLLAVFYILGWSAHALLAGWTWDDRKLTWLLHP